jgi:hypothetical protein
MQTGYGINYKTQDNLKNSVQWLKLSYGPRPKVLKSVITELRSGLKYGLVAKFTKIISVATYDTSFQLVACVLIQTMKFLSNLKFTVDSVAQLLSSTFHHDSDTVLEFLNNLWGLRNE